MSVEQTQQVLNNLFKKNRIIFWYDTEGNLVEIYKELDMPGVEKIEIDKNQLGIKYRILKEEPRQKFLLFQHGSPPPDAQNWLLDVQLANAVFQADQVSLWLSELGLPIDLLDTVREYEVFFIDENRRADLKKMLMDNESPDDLCLKMLAVCVGAKSDPKLENILLYLLGELADGIKEKYENLVACGLENTFWKLIKRHFAYASASPSLLDFSMDLFKSGYARSLNEKAELNADALIFLKNWKDSHSFREAFGVLSNRVAELMDIESDIKHREISHLVSIDFFRLVDQKIIHDLVEKVANQTISESECEKIIRQRHRSFWFADFEHIYEALFYGARFLSALEKADLAVQSLPDGIRKYQTTWFQIDYLYRKFIYHTKASKQATILNPLNKKIDQHYSNSFLLKVNNNFQQALDSLESWDPSPFMLQSTFFSEVVNSFLEENTKIAVVVSDAMRYEIGVELGERMNREDRFSAEVEAMVSMLPSYTQLGMASLLPHQKLAITKDGSVQVDGVSTQGLDNRSKVLQNTLGKEAIALRSVDLMGMSKDDSRELAKNNRGIYIFHNLIDAVGDKSETEQKVFAAAEDALKELVDIVKKLFNANFSNVLVTSDHGFIYQDHLIDESEFVGEDVQGGEIFYRSRRFAIGTGLKKIPSVMTFTSAALGLDGDYQVQIPKSINRLRLKGAGMRYVHGGASLQEIVLPVIKVSKKRESDIEKVHVDVIASQSNVISTGQVSVSLVQKEPVSAKMQPRQLLAGIYAHDGTLISDEHRLNFDLTDENAMGREVKLQFILSQKASEFNNQMVYIKLRELIPNTTKYKDYQSIGYQLKRSITSDFDF
jgi:uncharacterized protein (TIGR02687 family)